VGGVSFGYDANGNRVSRSEGTSTVEYSYDAENRLVEVSNSADPDDTSFVYDADGVRIKRVHGDEATYYIGPIEIETNQGDVTETHSIYSLGGGVSAVRVVASAGDDGELTFTFGDHLGSSSTVWQAGELGDTDPGTLSFQRYYPYGEPRDDYDPALPTDHTFTGQVSDGLLGDGGTGLMYYGARYYDAQVGRFAAADTIVPNPANPQDLNRYAYVGNSPVNFTDPSGHTPMAGDFVEEYLNRSTPQRRPSSHECVVATEDGQCLARESDAVSRGTAERIFDEAKANPDIHVCYPYDGCYERTFLAANQIEDAGYVVFKVGLRGPLSIEEPNDDTYPEWYVFEDVPLEYEVPPAVDGRPPGIDVVLMGPDGRIEWARYHIGPAMLVQVGYDKFEVWVIDTLFDGPLEAEDWQSALTALNPTDGAQVEYLDASIYGYSLSDGWIDSDTGRGEYSLYWYGRYGDVCDEYGLSNGS
jgi:RHS repeat-associated protein